MSKRFKAQFDSSNPTPSRNNNQLSQQAEKIIRLFTQPVAFRGEGGGRTKSSDWSATRRQFCQLNIPFPFTHPVSSSIDEKAPRAAHQQSLCIYVLWSASALLAGASQEVISGRRD